MVGLPILGSPLHPSSSIIIFNIHSSSWEFRLLLSLIFEYSHGANDSIFLHFHLIIQNSHSHRGWQIYCNHSTLYGQQIYTTKTNYAPFLLFSTHSLPTPPANSYSLLPTILCTMLSLHSATQSPGSAIRLV